jgi:CRP/FNR family cyclic AMP-dependent transcriptional regulator
MDLAMDGNDIDFRVFARSAGDLETFAAGELVFRTGDAADAMWIVMSGMIEIEVNSRVIALVGHNYALGVLSLIDQLPRSSTARAREDSQLIRINSRRFCFMVEQMPNFGWYVMRQLADRLRATNAAL